jgi:hypothetical protein
MSLYWNTPEAVHAEHQYRTERLRRAARRPLFGLRRRPVGAQAVAEQARIARLMVGPTPADPPTAGSTVAGVPAQLGPSPEPRRLRAGAGSGRHAA